jgi:hypothetical protein
MVSDKEIEAAIKAIEAVPIMDDTYSLSGEDAKAVARAALEAAARVRAEANNECGEAAHPAPQPSRASTSLVDAEKAFLDRVWPKLQNGCYRAHSSIPVEIKGLDFNEFVRDGLCAVLEATARVREEAHPDDAAVDRFAAAMKAKLKWEREERGRHGWNDPEVCSEKYLARLLIEHLAKGNDGNFEDVANFCMMLHQRGAHPRVLADALMAGIGSKK